MYSLITAINKNKRNMKSERMDAILCCLNFSLGKFDK